LLRKIKITALPIIGDIMFLRKDVELLEGLPIAYIKSIDSIVLPEGESQEDTEGDRHGDLPERGKEHNSGR
jgi:hypothetical protein